LISPKSLNRSSFAPPELLKVLPGQEVDLKILSRTEEAFKPPKVVNQAFSGKGNRLGDLAEPPQKSVDKQEIVKPEIDPSKPTTSLQLRLADGSRINASFNTLQTTTDLYQYVQRISDGRPFTLLSGRPPIVLKSDDIRTLEEANLLNTVVIQQFQ
jgi:UBX domain-containing protein 1